MQQDTIGIDVSKAHLDFYRLSDGKQQRFSNDAEGLNELCILLGEEPVRVIFEATGAYHSELELKLSLSAHWGVKVNPARARQFAQAMGQLAKTDQTDAAVLARMGAALDLKTTPVRREKISEIRELHLARLALLKDRTACRNRLSIARSKLVKSQLRARLLQMERQIAKIDQALQDLIETDSICARQFEILTSIPGIGTVAAIAIIAEMPEIGTMNGKQCASLAGLAPRTRQSGVWKGRSCISGGRGTLRTLLYMPALVATRCNSQLKKTYDSLKTQGKPTKVALTAVMRKLVTIANALIRDDRKWEEIRT